MPQGSLRQESEEAERAAIKANLDVIGPFRAFCINNAAPMALLDDRVEGLTGDRRLFHSGDILLKH